MQAYPLKFGPIYKERIWGGDKLREVFGREMPRGKRIGESWELADLPEDKSKIVNGELAGETIESVIRKYTKEITGAEQFKLPFPLLIKFLDCGDVLSVQVHPDDSTAAILGAGHRGKTECWVILADGGVLFQGTRPGVNRDAFERALADHTLAARLNRFEGRAGDVFFIEARTVHALGEGCLLYEIQQTSDITFRVYDWDRMGLDGKPRPLHVAESLATIDFSRTDFGPLRPAWRTDPTGGIESRSLVTCPYFAVEQFRVSAGATLRRISRDACAVVTCIDGHGVLATDGGELPLVPLQTALLPAACGTWQVRSETATLDLIVASPQF